MVMQKQELISLINELPEEMTNKVVDYVLYIKHTMNNNNNETALLSEKELAKDWLKDDEEEAWTNL